MRCKFASCRSQLWSHSRLGMTPTRWEPPLTPSRMSSSPVHGLHYVVLTYGGLICRLIFPRWDVIAIILSIFLMTYTYIEAKSNYHRGSILILRYTPLKLSEIPFWLSDAVISSWFLAFISLRGFQKISKVLSYLCLGNELWIHLLALAISLVRYWGHL